MTQAKSIYQTVYLDGNVKTLFTWSRDKGTPPTSDHVHSSFLVRRLLKGVFAFINADRLTSAWLLPGNLCAKLFPVSSRACTKQRSDWRFNLFRNGKVGRVQPSLAHVLLVAPIRLLRALRGGIIGSSAK